MARPAPAIDSLRELADAAEVAWRNVLVAESQSLQADGCCSAPVWRGHLCEYHRGYADAIDAVLDRMRAIGWMPAPLTLAVIEAARGVVAEWTVRGDGGCEAVRRQRLTDALTAYEGQRTDA